VEAQQMVALGLKAVDEYMGWLEWHHGAFVDLTAHQETMKYWGEYAQMDRPVLEQMLNRKELTGHERQQLDEIKQRWRTAMAQPLTYGKDYERDLIDYMDEHQGEFYAKGGIAKSDTVPAMLTPGEYVVRKEAVQRHGVGFFEALNSLSLPVQALAQRVKGFASGGLVGTVGRVAAGLPAFDPVASLTQMLASAIRAPALQTPVEATPAKTVRVEFAAGDRQVGATIDARDECALLDLLKHARARAV
jgi:hypothetical protein